MPGLYLPPMEDGVIILEVLGNGEISYPAGYVGTRYSRESNIAFGERVLEEDEASYAYKRKPIEQALPFVLLPEKSLERETRDLGTTYLPTVPLGTTYLPTDLISEEPEEVCDE